jgi:hypothetical protein
MKRKTVKLNSYCAPQCTPIVNKLLDMGYEASTRKAYGGSGDVVISLVNPRTKFRLEYTTKKSVKGKDYVNWARVSGPADSVDRFLVTVGYQPKEENKVNVKQLKLDI